MRSRRFTRSSTRGSVDGTRRDVATRCVRRCTGDDRGAAVAVPS
jgi:hypothetical protein